MDHKILRPLSKGLETIIPTDVLKKNIGLLALNEIETIEKYFKDTQRENLLNELTQKDEGFIIINDDEFINDHLLIVMKSTLIENENNILFFLLPSILSFEEETINRIEELKSFLCLPSDQDAFFENFQICKLKCKIIKYTHEQTITYQNLN